MRQQPGLGLQPATETCQCAVGPDYPMAGHKDRLRIRPHSSGYSPHRRRASQPACQFSISHRATKRYLQQNLPHSLLKGCATPAERQAESTQTP